MAETRFTSRDYWLACAFALLDEQLGFALDLLAAMPERFGPSEVARRWEHAVAQRLRTSFRQQLASCRSPPCLS